MVYVACSSSFRVRFSVGSPRSPMARSSSPHSMSNWRFSSRAMSASWLVVVDELDHRDVVHRGRIDDVDAVLHLPLLVEERDLGVVRHVGKHLEQLRLGHSSSWKVSHAGRYTMTSYPMLTIWMPWRASNQSAPSSPLSMSNARITISFRTSSSRPTKPTHPRLWPRLT